ncbi:Zinc finger and BTB domain-containing protein 6, partial [Trichinella zimbabwensis]
MDHKNIHYGIRPFQCEVCQSTFSNRGTHYNHIRLHNNYRLYVCPLCKENFNWETALKGHLNAHQRRQHITPEMVDYIFQKVKKEVREEKRKLKNAVQETLKNSASSNMEERKDANPAPYNCNKQKTNSNQEDNGQNIGIKCELIRRPLHYNLRKTEGQNYWYNCISVRLVNAPTNTRTNENAPSKFQMGLNCAKESHHAHQNQYLLNKKHEAKMWSTSSTEGPHSTKSDLSSYRKQENIQSAYNPKKPEHHLTNSGPGPSFATNNHFFQNLNENQRSEISTAANSQLSFPSKEHKEKIPSAAAKKPFSDDRTFGKVNYEEKVGFTSMNTVNYQNCYGNNNEHPMIKQNIETNFRFPKEIQNQFSEIQTVLNSHIFAFNNDSKQVRQFKVENEAQENVGINYYPTKVKKEPNDLLLANGQFRYEYPSNLNGIYGTQKPNVSTSNIANNIKVENNYQQAFIQAKKHFHQNRENYTDERKSH